MMGKRKPDKLAMGAAAALAAGMSYGQWMAMQQPRKEKPKTIENGWLVCQYCGKPFKPKKSIANHIANNTHNTKRTGQRGRTQNAQGVAKPINNAHKE